MFSRTCLAFVMAATLFALLRPSARVAAAEQPLLVVVNTKFRAEDVSLAVLKDVFGGRPTFIEGERIIPINHPIESPLRVAFDKAILGLDPGAVGRFWVNKRIRAEGMPPRTAPSPDLAVRVVASLSNAISYATQDMLNPKIKAVTVDGKAATDPKYPLRR